MIVMKLSTGECFIGTELLIEEYNKYLKKEKKKVPFLAFQTPKQVAQVVEIHFFYHTTNSQEE